MSCKPARTVKLSGIFNSQDAQWESLLQLRLLPLLVQGGQNLLLPLPFLLPLPLLLLAMEVGRRVCQGILFLLLCYCPCFLIFTKSQNHSYWFPVFPHCHSPQNAASFDLVLYIKEDTPYSAVLDPQASWLLLAKVAGNQYPSSRRQKKICLPLTLLFYVRPPWVRWVHIGERGTLTHIMDLKSNPLWRHVGDSLWAHTWPDGDENEKQRHRIGLKYGGTMGLLSSFGKEPQMTGTRWLYSLRHRYKQSQLHRLHLDPTTHSICSGKQQALRCFSCSLACQCNALRLSP